MQMTAAVSLTLWSVDRRGNSKDLSGSTAEPTARAAPAINILGNNNHGCLFLPKLSVSMTDLFWKCLLFWQISGSDSDCSLSVCRVHADAVSATCAEAESTGCERLKRRWHHSYMAFFKMSYFFMNLHIFLCPCIYQRWINIEPSVSQPTGWGLLTLPQAKRQQVKLST